MLSLNHVRKMLEELENQPCQGILLAEMTSLYLYFGITLQNVPLRTPWCLRIYCAWRLESTNGIEAGYYDDADFSNPKLLKLEETYLSSIQCAENAYDLKLEFSNGLILKTFSYSVMDCQWDLKGDDGYCLVIDKDVCPIER